VVTYPSMMYKMNGPNSKNPIQAIFQSIAMKDRLPFQAMLAIAAKHRAGVEGKKETVQSLTHKIRALSLVNEHLQKSSDGPNDGTIYAVATMAVIEVSIITVGPGVFSTLNMYRYPEMVERCIDRKDALQGPRLFGEGARWHARA
jgi:hypothetical protein